MLYFIFALLNFILVLPLLHLWYRGIQRITVLPDKHAFSQQDVTVSVIVAARNEEKDIGACIESLTRQQDIDAEIILVNDRSEDLTGEIIDEYATRYENIHPIHIHELPSGWLGKNHALAQGAKQANGEWLLFIDADVQLAPNTIASSVDYAKREEVDHLPMLPENKGGSKAFRAFFTYWSILGIINFTAIRHVGIGAYNLISKSVYDDIGGHDTIRLRPDDDLKLGKRVVDEGFKQQLALGYGWVYIQWYASLPQMIKGLEKNLFAFLNYRLSMVVFSSLALIFFHIFPFVALIIFWHHHASLLLLATIVLYMLFYYMNTRVFHHPWRYVWYIPLHAIIFLYTLWRSTLKTLSSGGVTWRGTTYQLDELRKHMNKD
ncbi:glycosyltransferase [Texcoconibacillus texcoconensis]|uniref:4,4'-diaponeurosporenoate glycosyltransferase n=1 Tax=Texcoconibacillus texcoconensis TaxID=1095777 RepID=A0A840QLS0_9BACI|nr:glycosyltransferase family 2 protein [Texcoconibacillus texcoconensis]MBB5172301.1 glycosyltransferase involved in cell wall biosynthesis [Texcoconibacillus texcoconensis]